MIILSAQDLEDYGVRQTASTITFMGKAFVRGQTFAQRLRKMAIAMAEENMKKGSACLLVDFDTHVTLWREQAQLTVKPEKKHGSSSKTSSKKRRRSSAKAVAKVQTLAQPKSSGLKYRGQEIAAAERSEEEIVQAIAEASKSKEMLYRGKSIQASPERQPTLANRPIRYRGRLITPE